jgi:FixJ family two-component response regulator
VTTGKPLVAIVDDEGPVRVALGRLLRLGDYEVDAFGSGEEFLASLDHRRPACAILDVHLPGLSGLEVQERLRAAHRQIPVVFITASDDRSLDDAARASGGARLLRKPFSSEQLLQAVGVALRGHLPGASCDGAAGA